MTDERPLLLVLHIPKTGGTTLNGLVYANYGAAEVAWSTDLLAYVPDGVYHIKARIDEQLSDDDIALVSELVNATTARAVLGHFSFGLHRAFARPSAYVVLVRDPVERLISLHSHLLRWKIDAFGVISRRLGVAELASDPRVANDQARRISGLEPETSAAAEVLRQGNRNLRRHFVLAGPTDRFDEFLTLLGCMLGWQQLDYLPDQVDPRQNESVLSPPERAVIEKHNALDRALYEQVSESFERMVQAQAAEAVSNVTALRWNALAGDRRDLADAGESNRFGR
jgi:Sulfotransferase family